MGKVGELEERMRMELELFRPKDPLEILPPEIWRQVLAILEEPEDFKKAAKTNGLFNEMIEEKREEWVPRLHVVLGLVMPFVGKKEVFSLRRVSTRTKRLVMNFLDNNGFRQFYTDDTFTTTEELKFNLNSEDFGSDGQVNREIAKRWGPEAKAFPSRALHIDTRQPSRFRTINNMTFEKRILALFDKAEIQDIRHIKLTFTDEGFARSQFIKSFVKGVFEHLSNIRTVSLDFQWNGETGANQDYWKFAHQDYWKGALPALQHSLPLKLEFGPKFSRSDPIRIKMSRSYALNLKEAWMDLLRWRAEVINCPFMKKLELFNAQRLSLENFLRFLNAPELEELRVVFAPESLKTETKKRWNALQFPFLKKMLKPFPKLKVLRFERIDPRLCFSRYTWDFVNNVHKFLPTALKEKERFGKLTRMRQMREVWSLIPISIDSICLNGDGFNRKVCLKMAHDEDETESFKKSKGFMLSRAQRKRIKQDREDLIRWRNARKK